MDDRYTFELPEELIAQEPASPRDSARLLVYDTKSGRLTDTIFREIDRYLDPQTTLVINNSKVDHCRWLFDGGRIELFVLEKLDTHTVRAIVRPGKKFRLGVQIELTQGVLAAVTAIDTEGVRTIRLNVPHDDPALTVHEHVPLPPYIGQDDSLADEYQTVYAKPVGSLAAPTAGLHFTKKLLNDLKKKHPVQEVTLHVGLGTFAKLTDKNLAEGTLHKEQYFVSEQADKDITSAQHITAVGTTSVRTLESLVASDPHRRIGNTDIFIRPGFTFKRVDSLITNFHLPSTSLLMLVAALIGHKRGCNEQQAIDELQRIYAHAIAERYRFYSFGDAMLIR